MLLPGKNSPKTWFYISILLSTIVAFSESSGGKTLDIKLGFDLTQGRNGGPSLRIRDFQGSAEYNPRAMDEGSSSGSSSSTNVKEKDGPAPYSSESEGPYAKKDDISKEPEKASKSDNTGEDDEKSSNSGDGEVRVTRGIKLDDFDQDDNPKIHERYQKDSVSDKNSDETHRRYRRHIGRFGYREG